MLNAKINDKRQLMIQRDKKWTTQHCYESSGKYSECTSTCPALNFFAIEKKEEIKSDFEKDYEKGMPQNVDYVMKQDFLKKSILYKEDAKKNINKDTITTNEYCYCRMCTGKILRVEKMDIKPVEAVVPEDPVEPVKPIGGVGGRGR